MRTVDEVPEEVLTRIRAICLALPETFEEPAWIGTRWKIRNRTFAHALVVRDGHPPAYARAIGSDDPTLAVMFRSSGPELDVLRHARRPFVAPPWREDEIGLLLDGATDWDEVRELLTDSYCVQAPKRLAASVERPPDRE